jgi:zinc/manganese transport system permease protein
MTIGAVLSTALLIGPAAAALRITRRPGLAICLASMIGTVAIWVSVLLAYDSYYWPPGGRGWPVSFFVVTLIFLFYLLTQLPVPSWVSRRRSGSAWLVG